MYELDASDTDYSYEYSDLEYNTLDPYDYDLNDFTNYKNLNETPEEKLLVYMEMLDLDGVKTVLPGLLELQEEIQNCNDNITVNEDGDVPSDSSADDTSEEEEDTIKPLIHMEMKEVILKGGLTPLMISVTSANVPLVEYILSLGVNPNYCEMNSNNCALLALTSHIRSDWGLINHNWNSDAPKCLKILIEAGANVKIKGFLTTQESGFTALHYAARNNYWEMLDILIHAGADLDAMTNQRETALMLAATKGHVMCCNVLLLAGANAQLMDRAGGNAAYMAGIEDHKTLSDAIHVFSGSAQHNVELYKMWSQYVQKDNALVLNDRNPIEIFDNISNTCIESFCLALDSPRLSAIMQDQGLTINDLKLMSYSKLKEMGVSDEECDKIIIAMQDFKRNPSCKNTRISFEYGKPLRIVNMLEIIGNMSEHLELVDTNLECWYSHLNKKYQSDMVLHNSTLDRLQSVAQTCAVRTHSLIEQLQQLKDICDRKSKDTNVMGNGGEHVSCKVINAVGSSRVVAVPTLIVIVASLVAVTVCAAHISRRIT